MTTIGGVLAPGDEILQIVPSGDELIVEAKVSPADIAFIRVGQDAAIKFDAYDLGIYGAGKGKVIYISADTLSEETQEGVETYLSGSAGGRHFDPAPAQGGREDRDPARHDRDRRNHHRRIDRVPLSDQADPQDFFGGLEQYVRGTRYPGDPAVLLPAVVSAGCGEGSGLRLAPAFGHRFGEVREQHREPEPCGNEPGEAFSCAVAEPRSRRNRIVVRTSRSPR